MPASTEPAVGPADLVAQLQAACPHLTELGFRPDDATDARLLVERAVREPAILRRVATAATALREAFGDLAGERADPFDGLAELDATDGLPMGCTAILAFLATLPEARAALHQRGVAEDVTWVSLSDLGQQIWVHRLTYDTFGLHTEGWVRRTSWRGNLVWLGRLQFNLRRADPTSGASEQQWWLSTHIPQSGPLDPAAVDDSFARAIAFFADHFPEHPVSALHCDSWLLDEQLSVAVPGSNIAAFQRRWALFGTPDVSDESVLFFVFRRRGDVDRSSLPRTTRLERAVLAKLDAGEHWYGRNGVITDLDAWRGSAAPK